MMKPTMRVLAASLLIATAPPAYAQTTATSGDIDAQVKAIDLTAANKGQTLVANKIAAFFTNLAGSKENAVALVTALRNGTEVNLATTTTGTGGTGGTTTTTTFTPPTGKMGWGNVKIALALAQDALLQAGITKPTAAQLQTALLGGTITKADGTTVTLKGVLQMRADGMGWGQIAHTGGTKVGPVVSSLKTTNAQLSALAPSGESTTTATTAATKSKGVTTATGASAGGDKSSKGITTAAGATSASGSKGLVTAEGASAGASPKGNAYGRGIVTGAGTSAGGNVAATGGGKPASAGGAGVVTGGGSAASGVTTGQGQGGEHGKGQGKGKGGG